MEMTRCIMHEKELPNKLWVEVANTTVYLLNRMLTNALQKRTSFEAWCRYKPDLQHFKAWCRYKPDLQHFKAFGCLCFTYVQVKRDKLDINAKLEVFIGYRNPSKAYRIFQT